MGQLVFYSSQKILTCFAMSSYNLHVDSRKYAHLYLYNNIKVKHWLFVYLTLLSYMVT